MGYRDEVVVSLYVFVRRFIQRAMALQYGCQIGQAVYLAADRGNVRPVIIASRNLPKC
jgi:hypothetical protein